MTVEPPMNDDDSAASTLGSLLERITELFQEQERRHSEALSRAGAIGARSSLPPSGASQREREAKLEGQLAELAQECTDLERQNSNYLSLYVASSQLHGTLVHEDVLRSVKEVVLNLIGSDQFAIYLADEERHNLCRAASEGSVDPRDAVISLEEGPIAQVVREGAFRLGDGQVVLPSGRRPLALVPLVMAGQPIGCLVLLELLIQKTDFDAFDLQLFELLAAHAASALSSSLAYRRLEEKCRTLRGLVELFKGQMMSSRPGEG